MTAKMMGLRIVGLVSDKAAAACASDTPWGQSSHWRLMSAKCQACGGEVEDAIDSLAEELGNLGSADLLAAPDQRAIG